MGEVSFSHKSVLIGGVIGRAVCFLAVEGEKFGAIGGKRCDRNKPGGWMIFGHFGRGAGLLVLNLTSGCLAAPADRREKKEEGKDGALSCYRAGGGNRTNINCEQP